MVRFFFKFLVDLFLRCYCTIVSDNINMALLHKVHKI